MTNIESRLRKLVAEHLGITFGQLCELVAGKAARAAA